MSRRIPPPGRLALAATALGAVLAGAAILVPDAAEAQGTDVRSSVASLGVAPLRFDPPEPDHHRVSGVDVFYLEDATVPLVNVIAYFEGGYARFPRDLYAAGTALPALLRYGGTATLAPDSVDKALEFYALQTSFGGGGESVYSSLNTLSEHLDVALALWSSMLRDPGFDASEVEVWRGRELDAVRRRPDDPGRLAFTEFNRLLYGDHPVGWEMAAEDLTPEKVSVERLRDLHGRIVCKDNLVLGITGDVAWSRARALVEEMLAEWPPCAEELPPSPAPSIRDEGGVFVIPRPLEQSVLVMAHPTDVHLGEVDYFPAQIGNSILGGGGFSSRLLARVRTEEGYAYSAASLWTMPKRYQGIVGAITRTRPENAAPALELILSILEDVRREPPSQEEVAVAVDRIANGFVFNFETAAQIVSRRISFRVQELPDDWLERYLQGIQGVSPQAVRDVFRHHLRPGDMTVLIVGDPERMDMEALAALGPVTFLEVAGAGGEASR